MDQSTGAADGAPDDPPPPPASGCVALSPQSRWIVPTPRPKPSLLQPVHLRSDVAGLPRLVFRGISVIIPALVLIVVFALFEASGDGILSTGFPAQAFNWLIFPPPIILPFLAGLLTQRSSYLAGGLVGLLGGVLFSVYVMTGTFGPTSTGDIVGTGIRLENVAYALITSVLAGLALGAVGGVLQRLGRVIAAGT